jgi:hypothetical protein
VHADIFSTIFVRSKKIGKFAGKEVLLIEFIPFNRGLTKTVNFIVMQQFPFMSGKKRSPREKHLGK